jgi:hypothetical protein
LARLPDPRAAAFEIVPITPHANKWLSRQAVAVLLGWLNHEFLLLRQEGYKVGNL